MRRSLSKDGSKSVFLQDIVFKSQWEFIAAGHELDPVFSLSFPLLESKNRHSFELRDRLVKWTCWASVNGINFPFEETIVQQFVSYWRTRSASQSQSLSSPVELPPCTRHWVCVHYSFRYVRTWSHMAFRSCKGQPVLLSPLCQSRKSEVNIIVYSLPNLSRWLKLAKANS